MGVRGLLTYVQEHASAALEWHKLHGRHVIIDGNNLAFTIFHDGSGLNAAFGGDYDKYARFIEEFFKRLQECEVTCHVVMDGGQPLNNKKLRTVRQRIKDQTSSALRLNPRNQQSNKLFPPIGRQVFVNVLKKMNIPVIQADLEADEQIAVLARKLGHTVISNDSDFFIYDVSFILLQSINYKQIQTETENGKSFRYIPCYFFNVETFKKVTGVGRNLLPLLATVLGNDYVATKEFISFYKVIGKAKGRYLTERHKQIKAVFYWLKNQNTEDTCVIIEKIAECMEKHRQERMKKLMKTTVTDYTNAETNLLPFFVSKNAKESKTLDEDVEMNDKENLNEGSEEVLQTSLVMECGKKLPPWFIKLYRDGKIPREIADILTKNYFVSPVQVEMRKKKSVYLTVERVVRAIYTMLWKSVIKGTEDTSSMVDSDEEENDDSQEEEFVEEETLDKFDFRKQSEGKGDGEDVTMGEDNGGENEGAEETNVEVNEGEDEEAAEDDDNEDEEEGDDDNDVGNDSQEEVSPSKDQADKESVPEVKEDLRPLNWYLRKHQSLWIKKLTLLKPEKADLLPDLEVISQMTLEQKKKVFYDVIGFKHDFEENELPDDLELIINIIIYWYTNSRSKPEEFHVMAILSCIMQFYIIDGKIGVVRSKKAFDDLDRVRSKLGLMKKEPDYPNADSSIKDLVAAISDEECLSANYNLFMKHHFTGFKKGRKYNKYTVHAFSEFQTCIYFIQCLNCILDTPYPYLNVENLWSGTFCYNVYEAYKKERNAVRLASMMMGNGTALERLFLKLLGKLGNTLKFTAKRVPKNVDTKVINVQKKWKMKRERNDSENPDAPIAKKIKKKKSFEEKQLKKDIPQSMMNNKFAHLMMDESDDDE